MNGVECYLCGRLFESLPRHGAVPMCIQCGRAHLPRPTPPAPRVTAPLPPPVLPDPNPYAPQCIGFDTCYYRDAIAGSCAVHGCNDVRCFCPR
jgi:hypothetical protein